MSSTQRQAVHALVDELPEDRLPKIQRVLEEEVRDDGVSAEAEAKRTRRLEALRRIDERNETIGFSTTAEQVDAWIKASRP